MTALCIGTFTACTTDADVLDESPSYVSFTADGNKPGYGYGL